MADLTELAHLCDDHLPVSAVVVGSEPADARDLDLLVDPGGAAALRAALRATGFTNHGDIWARFRGCAAEVVELLSARTLDVDAVVADTIHGDARSMPGYRHLRRPAPHHTLLLIARRTGGNPAALTDRRRARIADALNIDPGAWSRAAEEAPAWDCAKHLAALQAEWRGVGSSPTADGRPAAAKPRRNAMGRIAVAATARLRAARRRPLVVALSGLDGSGKTTQAHALVAALTSLGHPASLEWSRLTYDPAVERIARPVKQVLVAVGRLSAGGAQPTNSAPETAAGGHDDRLVAGAASNSGAGLRQRSTLLHHGWTAVVAIVNARGHRALARRCDVVVRDRYVLDSVVQLREEYGGGNRLPLQEWLLERVAPRPVRAYFLDVPPSVAFERKADFEVEELARHRDAYLTALRGRDIAVLDGCRPADDLAAEIARDVWAALEGAAH